MLFNNWRDTDLVSTILALIGLIVYIIHYETIICTTPYEKPDPIKYPNAMDDPRNKHFSTNIVRLIIMITTLLAIACLCMRQYYKIVWINTFLQTDNQSHINYQYNEIVRGGDCDSIEDEIPMFDNNFFFDIFVLCLFPWPYYDTYIPISAQGNEEVLYLLSEFMFAFMSIRIYFLITCLYNYSIYNDAYSMKLCRFYGVPSSSIFTFKCYIYTMPERTTMLLFSTSILILSYLLRIFEMPYFRMASDEWRQFD